MLISSKKYAFTEMCDEVPGLELGSGTQKLFFNTTACEKSTLPKDVERLYNYINTGKPDDELTEALDDAVRVARMDNELRGEYMRTELFIQDAIYEGRKIGEEEGRKIGEEEGRKEATEELNALSAFLIDNNRLEDLRRATQDPEFQQELLEEMRLTK